jgi:hypothetical protein
VNDGRTPGRSRGGDSLSLAGGGPQAPPPATTRTDRHPTETARVHRNVRATDRSRDRRFVGPHGHPNADTKRGREALSPPGYADSRTVRSVRGSPSPNGGDKRVISKGLLNR